MNDNSGVARAVAQSVFRGSLRYPFDVKEIAERRHGAFEGTSVNMRLDPEETCFSFEASSAEGLLYFLPIFLDYVYDPKQVHDVDANGHVTGALYEQSQRLERVGYQIMTAGLHRALYGAKDPKRSSMFGTPLAILGMTNQDVHNFHQKFYVPQTSTLIISGPSTSFPPSFPTSLLNTLNFNSEVTFTSKNQALGPTPPGWKRPWFPPIPPILSPKTADVHVDIPAHESGNRVWVSWNGGEVQPWSTRPPFELKLLADYLLVGDEAPVVKGLVLDGEDGDEEALCASVDVDTDTNPSIFTIRMDAIRPGEETTIASRLKNILAAVAQGGVDMVRMRCVLKNLNKEVWRDPLETMVALACEDAVFGAADGCDLPDAVEQASLTTYLAMTSDDWTHLLSDLLVNAPSVTVIGHASTTVLADIEARDRAAEKADGGGRRLAAAVRNADAAKRGSDEQKGRYDETEQRLRRWIELINDKREEKGMPKYNDRIGKPGAFAKSAASGA
ncbi:hypothetical protein MNV49_004527 [Pseudohyphozyma bogoriensis]|nr:hypothetical protein MNV49_004527 [Pseudohyphozyma bogoriensis]